MFTVTMIEEHLKRLKQEHLLSQLETFTQEELEALENQLSAIEEERLFFLQQVQKQDLRVSADMAPFTAVSADKDSLLREKGWEAIRAGKAAVLLVAGGQGTRLGTSSPKGMFPLSPVKGKSLFQMHMEKIAALQEMAKVTIPVAVMTSPFNHEQTVQFFAKNKFFGLAEEQVAFLTQNVLPLLTEEGKLFYSKPGEIAFGPDGNASAIEELARSSTYQKWQQKGVEYVQFVQVDNPLALPIDPEMVGKAVVRALDVVIKVVEKISPKESVGVLALRGPRLYVIEYSELSDEWKEARESSGKLLYRYANISYFCFSMAFIQKAYEFCDQLPWHIAHKSVSSYDPLTKEMVKRRCKKFERFIFDFFAFAKSLEAIVAPRNECFAPLKGGKGEGSVEQVQEKLASYERTLFRKKYGVEVEDKAFECDPKLYFQ